ncbi:Uncharacterized protein Fot_03294 [Forsythia ovata]|uniref:Uncharacterized protein n=1 Tax=Forsythia ovata TaxID=205694 RepID=A0ABD1X9A3_9LAMI
MDLNPLINSSGQVWSSRQELADWTKPIAKDKISPSFRRLKECRSTQIRFWSSIFPGRCFGLVKLWAIVSPPQSSIASHLVGIPLLFLISLVDGHMCSQDMNASDEDLAG